MESKQKEPNIIIENEAIITGASAVVQLDTTLEGLYDISLLSLSDQNYKSVLVNEKFSYQTFSKPAAYFEDAHIPVCGDTLTKGFLIRLTGNGPWEVNIDGVRNKTLNIEKSPFEFIPEEFGPTGETFFSIAQVKDLKSGCIQKYPPSKNASVVVYSRPDIKMHSSPVSCVGKGYIDYFITGTPPWTLFYTTTHEDKITNHELKITEKDGAFVGGAKRGHQNRQITLESKIPGTLNITRLCHKSSNTEECCVDITNVTHTLYDLPSAKLNSGKNNVDVIREGSFAEMHIDLKGTPPFSFEYVKLSSENVILNTYSVSGITDYEYVLKVSQEGTFRVTHVKDAYCEYP